MYCGFRWDFSCLWKHLTTARTHCNGVQPFAHTHVSATNYPNDDKWNQMKTQLKIYNFAEHIYSFIVVVQRFVRSVPHRVFCFFFASHFVVFTHFKQSCEQYFCVSCVRIYIYRSIQRFEIAMKSLCSWIVCSVHCAMQLYFQDIYFPRTTINFNLLLLIFSHFQFLYSHSHCRRLYSQNRLNNILFVIFLLSFFLAMDK